MKKHYYYTATVKNELGFLMGYYDTNIRKVKEYVRCWLRWHEGQAHIVEIEQFVNNSYIEISRNGNTICIPEFVNRTIYKVKGSSLYYIRTDTVY